MSLLRYTCFVSTTTKKICDVGEIHLRIIYTFLSIRSISKILCHTLSLSLYVLFVESTPFLFYFFYEQKNLLLFPLPFLVLIGVIGLFQKLEFIQSSLLFILTTNMEKVSFTPTLYFKWNYTERSMSDSYNLLILIFLPLLQFI